ncbi:MAG: prolipoprotein diacylglyceryl transferase [Aquiluna sp.]
MLETVGVPSPEVSFIDIGIFRVHFYALFILTGIALATWIADRKLTSRGAPKGSMLDIALWAVPFGIIGGRIFHVITHPNDYFFEGADLLATVRIWEGGLAIYGAVSLGAVGVFIATRQLGLRFWSVADAVAPGLLIAQGIGRLGNYFNQELFGLPTTLPWGLQIPSSNPAYPVGLPEGLLFHPTFAYEMIWNLTGAAVLILLASRLNLQWGKVFAVYLMIYSTGRIWVEAIRIDPSEIILGLRLNIWSALIGLTLGIILFLVQSRRHPGLEPSIWLPGREPVVEIKSVEGSDEELTK